MANESRNYIFTWKIKNFSTCVLKKGEFMRSPTFQAESNGGSEWFLQLYPRGTNEVGGHVCCLLYRIRNNCREDIGYSVEMIGNDGKIFEYFGRGSRVMNRSGWGHFKFISFDELNEEMKTWKKDILTFRCHLSSCPETLKQPAIESEGCTVLGVDRCCFSWNINNLSDFRNERKTIYIEKNSVFEFMLNARENEFEFNIIERPDEEVPQSKHLCCKVSLMTLKGIEFKSISASHIFEAGCGTTIWQIPALFTRDDLLNSSNDVVQNDSFTLNMEVSVSTGQYMSEIKNVKYGTPYFAHSSSSESISALQDDLRNMFETSKNSDVNLLVGSLTIPAHKNILGARSPVFSAMFDQNMLENETGVVDIQDLDAMTLNSLLEFVYTGLVRDFCFEKALKLLIAADRYQIQSLTENCSEFLKSQLSVENVCDVYRVADLINHAHLKYCAMEFVKMQSSEVLSSDAWSGWMKENVNLANEILFKLVLEFSP